MPVELPDSPEALGLTGFPDWREHQRETVEALVEAFQESNVVTVEAPTGSGKTIIGAAASRALGGSAIYLAHTIILQQQQLRTLPGAVTVTGRRNHPCLLPVAQEFGLTAEDADCPCELAAPEGCTYYAQWFRAMRAQDAVLNYAFMVRIVKAGGLRVAEGFGTMGESRDVIPNPFLGRRLMVCDEGHNLEKALLDADTVEIHEATWDRYDIRVPQSVDFERWLEWAAEQEVRVADLYESARLAKGELSLDAFKEKRRLKGMMQTLANIDDLSKASEGAGQDHQRTPMFVGRKAHGYTLQPLWVWNRAEHLLFRHAENTMIMSATLGSPGLTAKLLGLQGSRHLKIPSTFPVENRPVFYWPVSKMRHGMEETEKAKQAVALIELAKKFPTAPGVIHCNSYSLGKYLLDVVAQYDPAVRGRMIGHTAQNREAIFAAFEGDPGNTILVTPAATTGVDWDFIGWQMIPKVPYPDLGDDIVRLRYDYITEAGEPIGKQVYQQEAVKTLVQAAGRCVRTPSSKGVTVVTDAAFWPLYKYAAPEAFPDWFRAGVSWYKPKGT